MRFFFKKNKPSRVLINNLLDICYNNSFEISKTNKTEVRLWELSNDSYRKQIKKININDLPKLLSKYHGSFNLYKTTIEKDVDYEIGIIYTPFGDKRFNINNDTIFGRIGIFIDDVYFKPESEKKFNISNIKIAEDFINLSKKIYDLINPIYGYLYSSERDGREEIFPTEEQIMNLNLHYIHRLNFFSPQYVERIGKKNLLRIPKYINELKTKDDEYFLEYGDPLPVCSVEELSDEGILLSLSKNPLFINNDKKNLIEKQLGFK